MTANTRKQNNPVPKAMAACLCLLAPAAAASADAGQGPFIGAWKLEQILQCSEKGVCGKFDELGDPPYGLLQYDMSGVMSVQIYRDDRSKPDPEDQHASEMVAGMVAYAGHFEVQWDEARVLHHRAVHSVEALKGTTSARLFGFSEDRCRLRLSTEDHSFRLIWRRLTPGDNDSCAVE